MHCLLHKHTVLIGLIHKMHKWYQIVTLHFNSLRERAVLAWGYSRLETSKYIYDSLGVLNAGRNASNHHTEWHPNFQQGSKLVLLHFLRCPQTDGIDPKRFDGILNPRQPQQIGTGTHFALERILSVTTMRLKTPVRMCSRDAPGVWGGWFRQVVHHQISWHPLNPFDASSNRQHCEGGPNSRLHSIASVLVS